MLISKLSPFPGDEMHHGSRASGSSPSWTSSGAGLKWAAQRSHRPCLQEFTSEPEVPFTTAIHSEQKQTNDKMPHKPISVWMHDRFLADSVLWLFSRLKVEKTEALFETILFWELITVSNSESQIYLNSCASQHGISHYLLYIRINDICLLEEYICKSTLKFQKNPHDPLMRLYFEGLVTCMHRIIWR